MNEQHQHRWVQVIFLVFLSLAPASLVARETVLDEIVNIEEEILEVPEVERWETGLDLTVRKIEVGDASLHVEEEGSGIPLVLINGGPGGTHHYFHPWFSRAKDYARVIYYDQRGTGLSDFVPGENGYSVEQAVADLDAIRQALGVDKWVLLGYSYGGFLAQYYATIHPENVVGLVLLGSVAGLWVETGDSRQMDYLSEAEITRIRSVQQEIIDLGKEHDWPRKILIEKIIFNNFINGDWKRQKFFKPTEEEIARIARYEWVNDMGFNPIMNRSLERVNLAGAFDQSPFQTLILEGEWDLTWGEKKPEVLAANHPNAKYVRISKAGHGIYSESPERFFEELESFITGLQPVDEKALSDYRRGLENWRRDWQSSPGFILRDSGQGKPGSARIADAYVDGWTKQVPWFNELRRLGFALYDAGRYADALKAFDAAENVSRKNESKVDIANALIWKGHMLDLIGQRGEALEQYQEVLAMAVEADIQHEQYEMKNNYGDYAQERTHEPFTRVENIQD
jgi:proline-specific peptidase